MVDLQKEPKLARARQIPEWSTYDAEIAKFARSLAEKGVIQAGIVAADANVLAEGGISKEVVDIDDHGTVGHDEKDDHIRDEL